MTANTYSIRVYQDKRCVKVFYPVKAKDEAEAILDALERMKAAGYSADTLSFKAFKE